MLRFNFRGVGRSQGAFDHGTGELADAAAALDWGAVGQSRCPACWIAGVSFGAWIGMQLLMRRPEVEGFISIAAPASLYDFSFLAPCPSSACSSMATRTRVVPTSAGATLVEKLKTQKGIVIEQQNHPRRQPFLRRQDRRTHGHRGWLSRQAPARQPQGRAQGTGRAEESPKDSAA